MPRYKVIPIVLIAAACGGKGAAADVPAVTTVAVSPENITVVARSTISSGPSITGSLVADKTAALRAEVSGPVVAVLLDPGARVAKGTPIVRIDDTSIREAYLSAKSGVTQAQLAADLAQRDQQRAERLLAAGAIAQNALEGARRGNLAAQAALEDAKSRQANAQKNLDNTVVKAPYDGIISERSVNPGDIVAPGSLLVTVVDPSTMRLEGAVPADELAQVHVGAPISFTITGYPGRTFRGTISSVYPSADPQTRQVRLYARIPNTGEGLVAGLYATGRISAATREGIVAPLTAVDQRGVKPSVVRIRGGKTERVEVALGMRDEATESIEVTSGIAAGDTLLIGAAQGITPGTAVRVSRPESATKAAVDKPATDGKAPTKK